MEKYSIVFLLNDNNQWNSLFSHLNNLYKFPNKLNQVAVVITSTAILGCLKHADLDILHDNINKYMNKKVTFYLCINTVEKFQIDPDNLIKDITIATEGGILKVADLQSEGYLHFDI